MGGWTRVAVVAIVGGCGGRVVPVAGDGGTLSGSDGSAGSSSGSDSGVASSGNGGTCAGTCSNGCCDTTNASSGSISGSSGSSGSEPTWSHLYSTYLASGTVGNCGASICHGGISTASSCFTWLQGMGYIDGTNSLLASSARSCLSWYGGNMPPGGGSDPQAVSDFNAWAAAGGQNN